MLPSWCSWTVFLALLYLSTPTASAKTSAEKECTIHGNDGKYYDLTPLRASKDYEFQTEQGHKIVMNVCKSVTYESWGSDIPNPSKVGGVIEKQRGSFSIGETNSTLVLSSSSSNPKIVMENGSRCKSENGQSKNDRAGTIVEFICDTSVYGSGTPRLTALWPPHNDELACVFFIEWRTHYACPTGESGGPWGFFAFLAILVTILVMLYLVFGTLYNRYVLQLRGFDQIPQFSVQAMKYHGREAVSWFRDTMGQLYEGGQGNGWGGNVPRSWGGRSNPNVGFGVGSQLPPGRPIPRTNSRSGPQTNSFSHQAQVDVGSGTGESSIDPEPAAEGVSGFVRPTRGNSSTNPISHQNQTKPVSKSPAPLPVKKFEPGSSTAEERTFMLGDDDEEDDVIATPMTAAAPPARPPVDENASSTNESKDEPNSAAQLRGRDLGDEGSIRL
ncbi:mannose-6-phosphate receptor binding domain-containing protein [Lentinula raphanica]|nr:mannose-6-phosphate receptor binding domain-containing protein [Lentinula raphanica]